MEFFAINSLNYLIYKKFKLNNNKVYNEIKSMNQAYNKIESYLISSNYILKSP